MGKTHDSVFSEYHLFPLIIISFLKSQPFFHILQKKQPVPVFQRSDCILLKIAQGVYLIIL